MPTRRKTALLALMLAALFAFWQPSIVSATTSENAATFSKVASGSFSEQGNIASAILPCNSNQALGKTASATTTRVCAFSYGKEADQLSKLNYYGYRYYDPLSLTWTQADPLYRVAPDIAYDRPREMSLYAFSLNNPVRYLDPDGRAVTDQDMWMKATHTYEGSGSNPFAAIYKTVTGGVQKIGRGLGKMAAQIALGQYIAAGDTFGEVAMDVAIEATINVATAGAGRMAVAGGAKILRAGKIGKNATVTVRTHGSRGHNSVEVRRAGKSKGRQTHQDSTNPNKAKVEEVSSDIGEVTDTTVYSVTKKQGKAAYNKQTSHLERKPSKYVKGTNDCRTHCNELVQSAGQKP